MEQINPTRSHNDAVKIREEETCRWILRQQEWRDWRGGNRRPIWIYGIPGAGKTILSSYINQQVQARCAGQSSKAFHLYFYFSYRHTDDQTVAFLRWMLSQLCRRLCYVPEEIQELYRQNAEPTSSELLHASKILLQGLDIVYLVIDAIDECNTRADLLDALTIMLTDPEFNKIRLLSTSRDYIDIRSRLEPLSFSLPMSNSLVDEDIRVYVTAELQSNPRLSRWPPALADDILESLVEGAKGM